MRVSSLSPLTRLTPPHSPSAPAATTRTAAGRVEGAGSTPQTQLTTSSLAFTSAPQSSSALTAPMCP
jgi:hypothetical protein